VRGINWEGGWRVALAIRRDTLAEPSARRANGLAAAPGSGKAPRCWTVVAKRWCSGRRPRKSRSRRRLESILEEVHVEAKTIVCARNKQWNEALAETGRSPQGCDFANALCSRRDLLRQASLRDVPRRSRTAIQRRLSVVQRAVTLHPRRRRGNAPSSPPGPRRDSRLASSVRLRQ
jgi:hypothetical protein